MGSFNETCALSGLAITPGDRVKLLFLVRNPYWTNCDQRFAQRGCYHNDHWFLRTPPISGEYADYGRCEFDKSVITRTIEQLFSRDAVELPFGFNQYHSPPVLKPANLDNIIEAAWEGRLLVSDGGSDLKFKRKIKKKPEGKVKEPKPKKNETIPTWKRVRALLTAAKLPIMSGPEGKGYNAQRVKYGIVVVGYNEYGDNTKRLERAAKVLSKVYDCKIVYQEHQQDGKLIKSDALLMIVPKSGFEDFSVFSRPELIKKAVNTHPEYKQDKNRKLPVMAVMVREDIWNLYLTTKFKTWRKEDFSLEGLTKKIKDKLNPENSVVIDGWRFPLQLRDCFISIPFQNMLGEHVQHAFDQKITDAEKDQLINACAEAIRVEYILAVAFQSWQVPTTSGQDPKLDLKLNLTKGILAIIKHNKKEEIEEIA